jgi:hypothetical protein
MKPEKTNEPETIGRRGKMNTKVIGIAAAMAILTLVVVLATSDSAHAWPCYWDYYCNYFGYCWPVRYCY